MSSFDLAKPAVFLVVTGSVPVQDIMSNNPVYGLGGLSLRLPTFTRDAVDLVITGDDLVDFADLASAALFKPVCLPLVITALGQDRLTCGLSQAPAARRLAQRILAVLTAEPHPARPAGVSPTTIKKGSSS